MAAHVTMLNADAVADAIEEFGNVKVRAVIRKAFREQLKTVAAKAKAKIRSKSGDLARSIKVRAGKNTRDQVRLVIIGGGVNAKGETHTGEQFYGSFVELGHRQGKRPSKSAVGTERDTRRHVPAYPFLRPAFDETASQVADAVNGAIDDLTKGLSQ